MDIQRGQKYKEILRGDVYKIFEVKNGEVVYSYNGKGRHTISLAIMEKLLDEQTKGSIHLERI
jgi:hypothetical protein